MSKSVVESEQAIDTLGGWERNWMYYVCAMAVFVSLYCVLTMHTQFRCSVYTDVYSLCP